MSVLGKFKNKIIHRREDAEIEDLDEYRSTILGQRPEPEPAFQQPAPFEQQRMQPQNFQEPRFQEPFRRENISLEPISPYNDRNQFPLEPRRGEGNFEIMDRLKFIENQLAAIRSQTELVNERLKNIEARLGRSY